MFGKSPICGVCSIGSYRFRKPSIFPAVQMVGNGTESVILRDGRKIVFPVVLPECAVVPYHTSFLIPSAGAGLVYDLVHVVPTRMYSSSFIGSD